MVSVVVLTRAMPPSNALVRRLSGARDVELVRVLCEEGPERSRSARAREMIRGALKRTAARFSKRYAGAQLDRRAQQQIFGRLIDPLERNAPIEYVPYQGWTKAAEILQQIRPDVIVVFGTSIMPEAVTTTAKIAAINLHLGLAPHYRGSRCIEHAILSDDFENIGVTLHYVRPQIDRGEIVVQARPPISAGDDEYTLVYKTQDLGQRLLLDVLSGLAEGKTLAPLPQPPDIGKLYRGAAYTSGHRRLVRELIERGAITRYLDRKNDGKTREKPIVSSIQFAKS